MFLCNGKIIFLNFSFFVRQNDLLSSSYVFFKRPLLFILLFYSILFKFTSFSFLSFRLVFLFQNFSPSFIFFHSSSQFFFSFVFFLLLNLFFFFFLSFFFVSLSSFFEFLLLSFLCSNVLFYSFLFIAEFHCYTSLSSSSFFIHIHFLNFLFPYLFISRVPSLNLSTILLLRNLQLPKKKKTQMMFIETYCA